MNKSLFIIAGLLLSFCGKIGGQNDYFLTSTHQRFTENIHLSYIEIEVEITMEWELSFFYEHEQDTRFPTNVGALDKQFGAITLKPSIDRKIALLEYNNLFTAKPIHALSSLNTEIISVVPEQIAPNITINKRPKSFGALYTF